MVYVYIWLACNVFVCFFIRINGIGCIASAAAKITVNIQRGVAFMFWCRTEKKLHVYTHTQHSYYILYTIFNSKRSNNKNILLVDFETKWNWIKQFLQNTEMLFCCCCCILYSFNHTNEMEMYVDSSCFFLSLVCVCTHYPHRRIFSFFLLLCVLCVQSLHSSIWLFARCFVVDVVVDVCFCSFFRCFSCFFFFKYIFFVLYSISKYCSLKYLYIFLSCSSFFFFFSQVHDVVVGTIRHTSFMLIMSFYSTI